MITTASRPGHRFTPGPYGPRPAAGDFVVPVARIHRRDVPGPWWPAGTDLLQVLWCPDGHGDPPARQADDGPVLEVRRRRIADVTAAPAGPPAPVRYDEDGYPPHACSVTAEHVTGFPFRDELPEGLRPRLRELVPETGDGGDVITRRAGRKPGGRPTWHLSRPTAHRCDECGTDRTLLCTIAGDDEAGVVVDRWGDLRIFTCPADRRHAFQADLHRLVRVTRAAARRTRSGPRGTSASAHR